MKHFNILFFFLIIFSCTDNEQNIPANKIKAPLKEAIKKEVKDTTLQKILDKALLNGAILVYNAQSNTYYSNDFSWAKKGQLPASTFKIANSMIALETGVVEHDSVLFKWDGMKRMVKAWEQDLIFKDAFRVSCVPCYQNIARRVGVERMNAWLKKLEYGNPFTVKADDIDLFWLTGDWTITPFQEIDFLTRLYASELPVKTSTMELVKEMMIINKNDTYVLRGKTGWTMNEKVDNGWFVGYIEKGTEIFYFATNLEPKPEFDMKKFPAIRKEVTTEALEHLGIIPPN